MITRRGHHQKTYPDLVGAEERSGEKAKTMYHTRPRVRRSFDEDFKRSAVEHWLHSGKRTKDAAAELGISTWNLRGWKKQFESFTLPKRIAELEEENRALRRELLLARQQVDIAKNLGHLLPGLRRRI